MEVEKGKTYKYLREKRDVAIEVKESLKQFARIKKAMLVALKEGELTIGQLSEKLILPKHEVVYYLMTLEKYGFIQPGKLDDLDEYYTYKLKNNGQD